MGLFSKLKSGLKKTRDAVVGQIDSMLKSFTKIDEDLFEELEELLVMGDVGVETANKICGMLRVRVREKGITKPAKIMDEIAEISARTSSSSRSVNEGLFMIDKERIERTPHIKQARLGKRPRRVFTTFP